MTLPKGVKLPTLSLSHQLHPTLLSKTGFHEETLARLGLMKSSKEYMTGTKFISESEKDESNTTNGAMMGLEFLSLCRSSMMDVQAEYQNYD